MIPEPLKSPLRALSVDVIDMICDLKLNKLMAFEYGESWWKIWCWCTGTWMRRKNKRDRVVDTTGRSNELTTGALDYRSAGDYIVGSL